MRRLSWLVCALLMACGDMATTDVGGETLELASGRFTAPIYVQDAGHFSRYVYHGVTSESFWVDLNVRNASPTKEVGIVWSNDGFRTQTTTRAVFEASQGNGRERWGVDVRDFANLWGGSPIEVEYAAYVTMNGRTEWSALRNHFIYAPVTPERPVRLLDSSVALVDGAPQLRGSVRALNVSDRHVFVRFTTDDWATYDEVEATFGGKDFAFDVALSFAPNTESVAFAVRLEAEGESHWDNKNGENYRHQLAPSLVSQSLNPASEFGLNGYLALDAGILTGLGVDGARVRFDGGEPVALPLATYEPGEPSLGFSAQGVHWVFGLGAFAPGAHSLELEVSAGPFVRRFAALSFTVDPTVASAATLPLVPGTTPWDLAFGADGKLYVATDRQVFAYDELGDTEPVAFAETPEVGYLRELTVDAQGRVYALHTRDAVVRWLPDGQVDTSFGSGGVRLLNETYGPSPLCFPADFRVVGERLVVVDSCNTRLVRFTLDGEFVDEASFTQFEYDFVGSLNETDGALWLSATWFDRQGPHAALLQLDDSLAIVETVRLDARLGQVDNFVVSDAGIWISGYDGILHLATPDGEPNTGFAGGGDGLDLPGAHGGIDGLAVLAPNLVVGIDRAENELELYRAGPEAQ